MLSNAAPRGAFALLWTRSFGVVPILYLLENALTSDESGTIVRWLRPELELGVAALDELACELSVLLRLVFPDKVTAVDHIELALG